MSARKPHAFLGAAVIAALSITAVDSIPHDINRAATANAVAERLNPPTTIPTGLWGRPFAPAGLSDCDEASFYRQQWGLPERFDRIIFRESRCLNRDDVRTFCCHGMYQLYVSLHLRDHRLVDRYHECGVFSHHDLNSDVPIEKQRSACAAAAVFAVSGWQAWSTA